MTPLSLALVHHANQHLITDGYDNREGLSDTVDGYARVLDLHAEYEVPLALHLSGTLVEAIAWHRPEFFERVEQLAGAGLLMLVGGTYAENVMPLFPPDINRLQLEEALWLYEHQLGCPPGEITVAWLPERVWARDRLAPTLADPLLPNGGYRFVLLDDRLLFPTDGRYPSSRRAAFDVAGPLGGLRPDAADLDDVRGAAHVYRIAGGSGLAVVPLSTNLRYWVPPRRPDHWQLLEWTVEGLAAGADETLLVYGDDLEKTAGVAGWEPALDGYEAFLRWLVDHRRVVPVRLDTWLERHPPREERVLEDGTFFELAQAWGAGEDYRGWSENPSWAPYARSLARAERRVRESRRQGGEPRLLALAWKHLLASSHETAWHDEGEDGAGRSPAPWARALASHARAALPIAAAADWFSGLARPPQAERADIDEDGEEEIVLRNELLFAVVAPCHGGRLVYLFERTAAGGVLSVGNPTDHWNFQETLNRYMDVPPNHPAALADVGFEHDRYRVASLGATVACAWVELENVEADSLLCGATKALVLTAGAPALAVCYRLPAELDSFATEACLSPDYHRLLQEGRRGLGCYDGETWRGFRARDAAVWLARAADEETWWAAPAAAEAGHGFNLRLGSGAAHFHLLVGCGRTDAERCCVLLAEGREVLHELAREPSSVGGRQSL